MLMNLPTFVKSYILKFYRSISVLFFSSFFSPCSSAITGFYGNFPIIQILVASKTTINTTSPTTYNPSYKKSLAPLSSPNQLSAVPFPNQAYCLKGAIK